MTPEQIQSAIELESIFTPTARRRRDEIYPGRDSARFVHYTSSEAALSIIGSKRLWMRSTTCMADYREVQHGFELINAFFVDTTNRERFSAALDACSPGIAKEAIDLFNAWWSDIQFNTYISSISEHDNKEDFHGRLSMWRAFGGQGARVALVFNVPWISPATPILNVILSPVSYSKREEVHDEINAVIENIKKRTEFLKSIDRKILVSQIFNMLVVGVTCLKHEGFREEREWRVLYSPKRAPSKVVEQATITIGGVPQIVYKLPLDVTVSDALADLDVSQIFDRLIIGPSAYAWAQYEAFVSALTKAGVALATEKVFISDIPIRS